MLLLICFRFRRGLYLVYSYQLELWLQVWRETGVKLFTWDCKLPLECDQLRLSSDVNVTSPVMSMHRIPPLVTIGSNDRISHVVWHPRGRVCHMTPPLFTLICHAALVSYRVTVIHTHTCWSLCSDTEPQVHLYSSLSSLSF